ncbi:MAG TPA: hypothetical protein VFX28_04480 [Methylomirabilota bacterium]|nr:hypothetical protein [Methylomirabilota bacterium]
MGGAQELLLVRGGGLVVLGVRWSGFRLQHDAARPAGPAAAGGDDR